MEKTMEELHKALITKVSEQLTDKNPNIEYLGVLNLLLGTVTNGILAKRAQNGDSRFYGG